MKRIIFFFFLLIVTSCSQPKLDPNYVMVDANLSIEDFLTMVAKVTRNEILREEKIEGNTNFVTPNPVLKSELVPLVNAIVDTKEMTLVRIGKYKYKIVKTSSVTVCTDEDIFPQDGRHIGIVYSLDNFDGKMIQKKIKPLLSKNSKVVFLEESNLLSITSSISTLRAISKLMDKLKEESVLSIL